MNRDYTRRRVSLIMFSITVVVFVAISCQEKKPTVISKTSFDPTAVMKFWSITGERTHPQMLIDVGTAAEADAYAQHIEDDLGIKVKASLDDVLEACGYGPHVLTGREAEIIPSAELMKRFQGNVVASSFFAPKIIDVSDVGGAASEKQLGWRKLVRLRVAKHAPLEEKGIIAMFLLFNVLQDRKDIAKDPFSPCIQLTNGGKPCSQQNQVMLVVGSPLPGKDSAYWMVFKDAAVKGGERGKSLIATFDGGDIQSSTTAETEYFVPRACEQCHGGSATQAKLNYLDSDHWNDRIQDDDDFADLRLNSTNGVLFDGTRDVASAVFKAAFDAIKTLNSEIAEQNCSAGGDGFQIRAVENWLRIHATNIDFLPQIDRALQPPATNPKARVWNRGTPTDEPLLQLLNRFCFRCHSSFKYHVFDKEAVFTRKDDIVSYVEFGSMPQDRKLDSGVKQKLLDLINALQ